MQTRIPCVQMRGGTSRGPFFLASDLPGDPEKRDEVLIAIDPDADFTGAPPVIRRAALMRTARARVGRRATGIA